MKNIKDYELVYISVFKWHKKHIWGGEMPRVTDLKELDLIIAVIDEIQRQNGYGDMESYKLIYRRVLDWHEEHAFPRICNDWEKITDSFKQFDESSQFEAALICAAAEEIRRNYYNDKHLT